VVLGIFASKYKTVLPSKTELKKLTTDRTLLDHKTTMKRNSSLIALIFLSLSSLAQPGKLEQQILGLSKKKFDWTVSKNIDSLKAVLDERVIYVHSNGWTQNKQEMLEDFISGKLSYERVDVSEASVRLYENTAIVNGKGKFSGFINKTAFALDLLYTEIYIKKGNRWLLASRHANRLP